MRRIRQIFVPTTATLAALFFALPAISRGSSQVIVLAPPSFVAGETIECSLSYETGPSSVTVTSDPPGVVSYQGPVSGTSATLELPTDPDASSGPVTIYFSTNTGKTGAVITSSSDTASDGPSDIPSYAANAR